MPLDGLNIGRYHLLRLIGSGGMGEVYLAKDTRIERQIAIKVIRGEAIPYLDSNSSQDAGRLFEREARAIARLNHSHILPLFDYGEELVNDAPLTYMVMPYCQEGSIDSWLRQKGERRYLPPQEAAYLLNQAADALQYAHDQQLIHQDVKPSNFLIRTMGESGLPDFGVAKFIAANSSNSQSIRGTPSYMAPEQWEGNPVTETDQYALGIMAYQLVTGRLPFRGGPGQMMYQHLTTEPEPPSTHMPSLPIEIDSVILYALAKKPEDRFASITAFARAFQEATGDRNATVFQFTLQNTNVPTTLHMQDRPANLDPYATAAVVLPSENHQPPYSTSDEKTVITGDKTVISGGSTPPPKGDSLTVDDNLPAASGNQGSRSPLGTGRILLLALLALLLIAGSLTSYYFVMGSKLPFSPGPDTTATARTHGTAQAQTQATANAFASTNTRIAASATAQGRATATTQVNPYPPNSGTLVINDQLSDNSKGYGWEGGERDGGFCTFTGGAYHSNVPLSGTFHSCLALKTNFTDFAFEVQAKVISGTTSGIVFRANRVTTHLYYFIIDKSGNFYLKVYFDKFGTSSVIASGSDPAIKSDGNNLIAVVARGGQIELYINKHLIKTLNDTTFSSGQIGVVVLAGEAAFSNARVWKL
jgi:serine/threonine protein kinase